MLKPYDELRKIDVSPYCEKRDGYLYLNWARCIDLLRKNGAEQVYFVPVQNPRTGNSLFETETVFADKNKNTNRCYETRIMVYIDDKVYEFQSPVLNGTNPVKDNSMNQLRVWAAMCRSFVKCVAINTGLGFDLWLKEEERTIEQIPEAEVLASQAAITTIRKTCEMHGLSFDKWLTKAGCTVETLTADNAALMLRTLNERYGEDDLEDYQNGH